MLNFPSAASDKKLQLSRLFSSTEVSDPSLRPALAVLQFCALVCLYSHITTPQLLSHITITSAVTSLNHESFRVVLLISKISGGFLAIPLALVLDSIRVS